MSKTKAKLVSPSALNKPVWTFRRQLLGNLIPLIAPGPIGMLGIGIALLKPSSFWFGVGLILLACIVGWFSLSYFGLFENRKIKREMTWRLRHAKLPFAQRRYFVGVASPGYKGILDPHEDVGFLLVYEDRIEFFGETSRFRLARGAVKSIHRAVNIHSFVFLGGWIAIRGEQDSRQLELRVEPRVYQSLAANQVAARKLRKRLRIWAGL